MSFYDDLLFPTDLSYGSAGGPQFANLIQETPGGARAVVQRLNEPLGRWDINYKRGSAETAAILRFARVVHGAAHGFRFLDFNDFSTTPNGDTAFDTSTSSHRHQIGTGDGSTTTFGLVKTYTYGSRSASRRIRKPMRLTEAQAATNLDFLSALSAESDMHAIWINGTLKTLSTHYTIDYETGEVVFVTAPAAADVIEWAGYFTVPVRFGREVDDLLQVTKSSKATSETQTISLVEDPDSTVALFPERDPGGSSTLVAASTDSLLLISFGLGSVIRVNPDAAAASPLPCKMPVEADWMRGRLFTISNHGTVDSLAIQTSAGAAITTLAPGEMADFYLTRDAAGTGWYWLAA